MQTKNRAWLNRIKKRNRLGFSLVELIVVIAIMAVFTAILTPALVSYTERSRAQRDVSAMSEVANAVNLSMSNPLVYDELVDASLPENVSCYVDSGNEDGYAKIPLKTAVHDDENDQYVFGDKARTANRTKYYAAGNMWGVTITFEPNHDGDKDVYLLSNAVINKFLSNGTKKLSDYQNLYNAIRSSVGERIEIISQTYKNSDYTVFVTVGTTGGNDIADADTMNVYGQYSGTNLPAGEIKYYCAEGRDVRRPELGTENGGSIEDPECEHNYTYQITTEATCTQSGVATYTCGKCGDSYNKNIGKNNSKHSNDTTVNCVIADASTHNVVTTCNDCGNAISSTPEGHVIDEHKCTKCGYDASVSDATPPVITVTVPSAISSSSVTVSGKVVDNVGVGSVTVNGQPVDIDENGNFSIDVALTCGATNAITVFAADIAGNGANTTNNVESIPVYDYEVNTTPTEEAIGKIIGICHCGDSIEVELPQLNINDYGFNVLTQPADGAAGTVRYTWKNDAYGTFAFESTFIYGDGNGDGKVNLIDLVLLRQYLEVSSAVHVLAGADVNGDGEVTTLDLDLLRQYLTYMDPITGESPVVLGPEAHIIGGGYTVKTAPTEETVGNIVGICTRCGTSFEVELPKLNVTDYRFQILTQPADGTAGTVRYIWKEDIYGTFAFDSAFIYGDGTNDGKVNLSDLTLLRQYLVDTTAVDLVAGADANGDGEVSTFDLHLLRQYLVKQDPITGESPVVLGPEANGIKDYELQIAPTENTVGKIIGTCINPDCEDPIIEVELPKLNITDYIVQILTQPANGTAGTVRYTWKNSVYGTFAFDSTFIYGDVDGDGAVVLNDVLLLRQYLEVSSAVHVLAGADVNGDGEVTTLDLDLLRQYLTYMDPITGESDVVLGPQ